MPSSITAPSYNFFVIEGRDEWLAAARRLGTFGAGLQRTILVIGFISWPPVAQLVRGQILSVRENDYVTAARVIGVTDRTIMIRHQLPNVVPFVLVATTFGVAYGILDEAALSFLGLGVSVPEASWGNMLSDAQSINVMTHGPFVLDPAGILISATVRAITFIGDGPSRRPRSPNARQVGAHEGETCGDAAGHPSSTNRAGSRPPDHGRGRADRAPAGSADFGPLAGALAGGAAGRRGPLDGRGAPGRLSAVLEGDVGTADGTLHGVRAKAHAVGTLQGLLRAARTSLDEGLRAH